MKAKITFLTRHYPPNPNINGESVRDMVKYLEDEFQIKSNVICVDRKADGGGADREPAGHVMRLKTIYQGQKTLFRFFTFLYDGFTLTKKALKFKDTLIICTTSPPLLPFWASLIFNKKIEWALWSLDLFPEGFYATNIISNKNLFYKWVLKQTYKNKPSFLIALGHEQAKHLQSAYNYKVPYETLPCGVFFYQNKSKTPPEWYRNDKLFFGYCGNINDAHNPEIIKGIIDALDPEKHQIVLALYGNKAEEVSRYAEGKPGVILVKRVPREQLHFIDIHIVTLRKKWVHIAVPSKAVSAIFMGGALLFCGDKSSDNWQMFEEAGWFVEENEQIREQVKAILKTITKEEVEKRKAKTPELIEKLQNYVLNTYKNIADRVKD